MPFRGDNKVSNAKRCGINRKKMEGRWSSTRFIPLNDPDPIPICVNLSKIAKLRHAIPRIISIITENELETRFMHSLVEISYRFKIEYHRRRARNEQIQHLIQHFDTSSFPWAESAIRTLLVLPFIPYNSRGRAHMPHRARLFVCRPSNAACSVLFIIRRMAAVCRDSARYAVCFTAIRERRKEERERESETETSSIVPHSLLRGCNPKRGGGGKT